ncbi:MAG: HEAT repeat domain-containing protein [Candidatus Micrarchaeota archaeon]
MGDEGRKIHAPPEGWLKRRLKGWRANRRRRKIDGLLDLPEKVAAPELARLKFPPLPYLLESVRGMDAKSAKAAYLIGKVAEGGGDCREALHPLYDMLMNGDEMQKANSAAALAGIGATEACSMLLAALGDRNHLIRKYAAMGLGAMGDASAEGALKRVAEGDCDPEVRRFADSALKQIAWAHQP